MSSNAEIKERERESLKPCKTQGMGPGKRNLKLSPGGGWHSNSCFRCFRRETKGDLDTIVLYRDVVFTTSCVRKE